jgi:hypothetical protein
VIGHVEVDCVTLAARNTLNKLPYDVRLRALEERRHRIQRFLEAAAESFSSGSSGSQSNRTLSSEQWEHARSSIGDDDR